MAAPFIVTLRLDEISFNYFNQLRRQYFPTEVNFLSAHLTLFHHLPNEQFIRKDLVYWSSQQPKLHLQVSEIKSIGRGVAFKIDSLPLLQLHKQMQLHWKQWLTPQDAQRLWPHVTIQNKVSPQIAKETFAILQASFSPFIGLGAGFDLWTYENGPWNFVEHFPFNK